jgi:Tfp pilus assembly protein PilO
MKGVKHFGFILILISILGWLGLVRPQIKQFSENSLLAEARAKELQSYQTRLDHLKQIKQKGESVTSTLDALFLAMPKEAQIPEVLVMMESIGANTGVVFSSFSVGAPASGEVPVSVSFSGNLTSVNAFLDALGQNVRTARVKSQSVNSDSLGNLSISMQLGLIYQGE